LLAVRIRNSGETTMYESGTVSRALNCWVRGELVSREGISQLNAASKKEVEKGKPGPINC
jgi:hypothetical protein